jgi:3-oxoacyl-[acyl-carrier protein] reductase
LRAWDALKSSKGFVTFIAGYAAEMPSASMAAVGVINAAIVALAKAFADRGLKDGVQVNSVSPGPVMTGRRLSMIKKWASARGVTVDGAKQALLDQAGIGRYRAGGYRRAHGVPGIAAHWIMGTQLRIDGREVRSI